MDIAPEHLAALEALANDEGFPTSEDGLWALVDTFALRSVQPGACLNCLATQPRCEPDMTEGWCHGCGAQSVSSLSVLAGLF